MAQAKTLYDYYSQQGKTLPKYSERFSDPTFSTAAQQAGVSSDIYTGTGEQNTAILGALLSPKTTQTTDGLTITDVGGGIGPTNEALNEYNQNVENPDKTIQDPYRGIYGAGDIPEPGADKLLGDGAVSTGTLPSDQSKLFKTLEDKFKKSDDYISQLMSLYVPTEQEKKLQAEIDQITTGAELGKAEEADRPATMGFITGTTASIERRANAKLSGLQRELQRLGGNREGQQKAISAAYDISRNNFDDLIEFTKLTSPQNIAINQKTGQVILRNPITGAISSQKIPGFIPEEKTPPKVEEYNYLKKNGLIPSNWSYTQYEQWKYTQAGTEKPPSENTQVVQLKDGRDVLIDKDTGEVLKEISLEEEKKGKGFFGNIYDFFFD